MYKWRSRHRCLSRSCRWPLSSDPQSHILYETQEKNPYWEVIKKYLNLIWISYKNYSFKQQKKNSGRKYDLTITYRAARVRRGELFIKRASEWEAHLVYASPCQFLNNRYRITLLQRITYYYADSSLSGTSSSVIRCQTNTQYTLYNRLHVLFPPQEDCKKAV